MSSKFNYSPCLFCTDEGESFTFVIKPCEEKEELRALVEYGGGDVVSTPCDTGVVFIPPNVGFSGDDEVYSTKYIRDCCERNLVLDLRPYRLNKRSIVPEEIDVREILCKRKTWSDAFRTASNTNSTEQHQEVTRDDRVFKKPYSKVSSVCSEESDSSSDESEFIYVSSDVSEDRASGTGENITIKNAEDKRAKPDESCMMEHNDQEDDTGGSESTRKTDSWEEDDFSFEEEQFKKLESYSSKRKAPHKRLYTEGERRAMLNYIVSHKLGSYVKGNEIWKKMEVKKVCPGRTWQSLKEHFRKYILENIDKYDLPKEIVRQLKA